MSRLSREMWESRCLTVLWASAAYYRDTFYLFNLYDKKLCLVLIVSCVETPQVTHGSTMPFEMGQWRKTDYGEESHSVQLLLVVIVVQVTWWAAVNPTKNGAFFQSVVKYDGASSLTWTLSSLRCEHQKTVGGSTSLTVWQVAKHTDSVHYS
jgi:hypothetical protein